MIEITPMMIKAAWVEGRRWWPHKVVEAEAGQKVAQVHYFRVVETCILVDEPQPGFAEAIRAALASIESEKAA